MERTPSPVTAGDPATAGRLTVRAHLLHVFDEFGVRTRTAAVTRAAQLGIVGLGGEVDRTGP